MERLISLLGLAILLGIGYAFSKNRGRINWRTIGTGLGLQLLLGIVLLKIPWTANAFEWLTTKVTEFLKLAKVGGWFVVYGSLEPQDRLGYIFAVDVGVTIIFFSAFISILYYLGIIQLVIGGIAKIMRMTMGTSGAETLSCSANIFVGQTEAPFLIKPYVEGMTLSELHAVMVGGYATVAGGVLAAYIGMGISATHLIIASVMSAPAALVMAKMMVPETDHSVTAGDVKLPKIEVGDNIIDAAAQGTTMGLKLALNVMAIDQPLGDLVEGFVVDLAHHGDGFLRWSVGRVSVRPGLGAQRRAGAVRSARTPALCHPVVNRRHTRGELWGRRVRVAVVRGP